VGRISLGLLLALAGAWWMLTAPEGGGRMAGVVAVLLGVLLHAALGGSRRVRLRPVGLISFLPFFVDQSVRGGVDVARRAMAPGLPVSPGFIDYRVGLPEGPSMAFFVNCISLLPGTFSAQLEGRVIRVHLLARSGEVVERLDALEKKVAGLFGVEVDRG